MRNVYRFLMTALAAVWTIAQLKQALPAEGWK